MGISIEPGAPTGNTVINGEISGSVTAKQLPNIACILVMFKARQDNAGRVYVGGSGVTLPDGTTDATTGFELNAKEPSPWIPVNNLNQLYIICDNAGDDLTYIGMQR